MTTASEQHSKFQFTFTPAEETPSEMTPVSERLLEEHRQHLRSQWFFCFEEPELERQFVKKIIVASIKAHILKWWALATLCLVVHQCYSLVFYVPESRATIFRKSMFTIHLCSVQMLLVVRFLKVPCLEKDVILLLAGMICTLMIFIRSPWKMGAWLANDGCLFYSDFTSCPSIDTNEINQSVVVIFTYLALALGMPVRAGCLLCFAVFTPVVYLLMSLPDGWSPHNSIDIACQTLLLILISGALWKGRRRTEFHDRIDWLRTRALKRRVTDLKSKASLWAPGAEPIDLALNKLEDALRWENSGDVRLAHKNLEDLGLTQTDIVAKERAIRKRYSETFGVSVNYLLSEEFTRVAQESTGLDDPSFYEISDAIFEGDNPIGENVPCPRDGNNGCSYLDTLAPEHKGPCTHFLSWTWAYRLTTVQSSLRSWLRTIDEDPTKIYFWMCFFVNNQHRILKAGSQVTHGSDNLQDVFEANLDKIGKVVALLDNWMDSTYLSRIWCIYEQFISIKLGIEVSMILPPASAASLLDQIDKGKSGILFVKEQLGKVDSRSAGAKFSTDETKVKQYIEQSVGFDAVDKRIIESLTKWMASEVQHYMKDLVDDTPAGLSRLVRTVTSVARRSQYNRRLHL